MYSVLFLSAMFLAKSVDYSEQALCGEDQRVFSNSKPDGRLRLMIKSKNKSVACSGALVGKSCFISAGHCFRQQFRVEFVEFNTPRSRNGAMIDSALEDRYEIDFDSLVKSDRGAGNDYAIVRLLPNAKTGQLAGNVQGYYSVKNSGFLSRGQNVQIVGYGTDVEPDKNQAQQIGFGAITVALSEIRYRVDTTPGNSGSGVILSETGEYIGVHNKGGCEDHPKWGANSGTSVTGNKEFHLAIRRCLSSE